MRSNDSFRLIEETAAAIALGVFVALLLLSLHLGLA